MLAYARLEGHQQVGGALVYIGATFAPGPLGPGWLLILEGLGRYRGQAPYTLGMQYVRAFIAADDRDREKRTVRPLVDG